VDDPSYALSVSFFDGIVNSYLKSFWNFHVRAVRGGP
jgi:hypothetical protein